MSDRTNGPEMDAKDEADFSDEEVKRLKKRVRLLKWSTGLKLAITLFLIIGIVVYLYAVYAAASSLSLEDETITSVAHTGSAEEYEAKVNLTISNPSSNAIEVERISYDAYLEGNYVGDGVREQFSIAPGTEQYSFKILFNIKDLPPAAKSLFLDEGAELTIKGDVTIPAKVFGWFTYTRITLPYSITETFSGSGGDGGGGEPSPVFLAKPVRNGLNEVLLNWTQSAADDFARYEVHRSTSSPAFTPTNATKRAEYEAIASTSHIDSGLERLTTYYYLIVVVDTEGHTANSNTQPYVNGPRLETTHLGALASVSE